MEQTQSPAVSICIPTYNQTTYLTILLKSITAQTFTDYELIISDDSNTQDVKFLIDKFDFGERLRYFKNPVSLGSPSNWNAAISKAKGRYIKIMHHDDAFSSANSLSEMIDFIETGGFDYIYSFTRVENVKDVEKSRIHSVRKFARIIKEPYRLFFGNSIGAPSTLLIKNGPFTNLQYDKALIWLVDVEYYTRLFKISSNGGLISQPLILTHDAADHQLTSRILLDFELQAKEQAILYESLAPLAPFFTRFLMQVYLVRLLYKGRLKNLTTLTVLNRIPLLVKIYFSLLKFKPLYFGYYIFIRFFDMTRKIIF